MARGYTPSAGSQAMQRALRQAKAKGMIVSGQNGPLGGRPPTVAAARPGRGDAARPKRKAPANARSMPKPSSRPLVQAVVTDRMVPTVFETRRTPGWRINWGEVALTQNVLMRRYGNVHAYERLIRKYQEIFWAAMVTGKIPKAAGRRRLTITTYVRSEEYRLDRGNLVGGGKPFLDAAVRAGLIINDTEHHLDDHYHQAIDADERVEVLVEDI